MSYSFLGKTLSGPFTIPSGIIATAPAIIEYFFQHAPQVGVMTTKSIGPVPRDGNREPIMTQYSPGCFMNAVGLTNPGADVAAQQLRSLQVPEDRFLLTSIFGGSVDEIVEVAILLAPYSDGLELNLSCPHAKGYGMAMGQDANLVREITSAVKQAVDIPVVPKLTPNVPNIGEIAAAAVEGGADALCAINTVGPGYYSAFGEPVLSNKMGGMSGRGVLPIALNCVKQIREAVDVPIIGCGGLATVEDLQAMRHEGASIFGIGSALTGLSSEATVARLEVLEREFAQGEFVPGSQPAEASVDMSFAPFKLVTNERVCDDIAILTFDGKIDVKPGEFVHTWVPGLGEKPFSALTDDPFSLVVIDVGIFTHELMSLEPGSPLYARGPYGVAVEPGSGAKVIAVAGGTGLAAVYQIARDHAVVDANGRGNAEVFLGARSADRLYFRDECQKIANTHIATDDGSEGHHGLVTELLDEWLSEQDAKAHAEMVFYNCGPAPMVHASVAVQRKYVAEHQIFSAIDYLTKCGVGVCGACHAPDGRRLCVDGPFMSQADV